MKTPLVKTDPYAVMQSSDLSMFPPETQATFSGFRDALLRVLKLEALEKRMLVRNLVFNPQNVSLMFDFFPRTKNSSAAVSANSDVVYWITYLIQTLGLKGARRIPRYISDQFHGANILFAWEVEGLGYIQITPYGPISSSGLRPGWLLSFLTLDHPSMDWRRSQLTYVKNVLQTLSSFEYASEGKVRRNPTSSTYFEALHDLRKLLVTTGLL